MAEAIRAVRQAFVELSAGRATMPVRARVDVPRRSGISLTMPGYLAGSHQLATKIVAIFPENLTRTPPLPTINALVVVLDPDTGLPAGALHGGVLTAIRTGAASGVATEELARADVRTAGVLGRRRSSPHPTGGDGHRAAGDRKRHRVSTPARRWRRPSRRT